MAVSAQGTQRGTFVDVRGTKTHVHEAGSGPPVLLVHGSGPGATAWANWRFTFPHLTQRFRVYAYDIPGFGYTERDPNVRYGMVPWVEHLLAFVEDVVREPVMIVGNSLGGALAIAAAVARPALFERIALMGPACLRFPLTEGLDRVWGYEPSEENMRRLVADYFVHDRSIATPELIRLRLEASLQPGFQEAFSLLFPAPRQRWVDAIATDEAKIRAITAPTLIVHGREDRVIPLDVSYRLLQLMPNAQLHVFGNCGHWTQVEYADDFNALLTHFFSVRPSSAVA